MLISSTRYEVQILLWVVVVLLQAMQVIIIEYFSESVSGDFNMYYVQNKLHVKMNDVHTVQLIPVQSVVLPFIVIVY